MAHTKAQGSVKGNRDSQPKMLGIKKYGGEKVFSGNILVRQKGSKIFAGTNVMTGKDFTLFAVSNGVVKFRQNHGKTLIDVVNG